MRGVLVLALLAACGFEHGLEVPDARVPDVMPDTVVPTWAIDSNSKKAVPAAAFEWDQLIKAYGVATMAPDDLWLMQESSGSLQDSIGTIQLDPLGNPSYRNAVAGWSRAAVGTFDTNANQGFLTQATGNLNGPSYLLLVYVSVQSAPASERSVLGIGKSSDHRYITVTPAPVYKGTGIGVTPTAGTINPMAAVHPLVLALNPTKLTYTVYTDEEKLTVNWTGTTGAGGLLMIGNAIVGAALARYLYGALWIGTKAELGDGDVKKLLQGLGWTVTGY